MIYSMRMEFGSHILTIGINGVRSVGFGQRSVASEERQHRSPLGPKGAAA
jgi:hypothetical protein